MIGPSGTDAPSRSTWADLRAAVGSRAYRSLVGIRLTSQSGDGLFQAGLASLVLFNPEQQATPVLVAGALSVSVLPFTVIGPFAGVLLDRWWRQRVLAWANLVRAGLALGCVALVLASAGTLGRGEAAGLYVLVLAALTINRFLLAGLGAGLPHTVPGPALVTANAVTPTIGTAAFAVGIAGGGGCRALAGGGATTDAALLAAAAVAWAVAATVAARLARTAFGPAERTRGSMVAAARVALVGLSEGAAHVWRRRAARDGLAVMAVHRFAFGVLTIILVVLARGYLSDDVDGAVGALVVTGAAAGVGALSAAVVTPTGIRRVGTVPPWLAGCLAVAAVGCAVPVLGMSLPVAAGAAFVVALAGQSVKIGVDTLVQTEIDDGVRGRAFAFYDVTYNGSFVLAAAVAALAVPADGYSRVLFAGLACWYGVAAVLARPRRGPRRAT